MQASIFQEPLAMTDRRDFTFAFVLAFSCLPLISVLLPRFMTFCPSLLGLGFYLYLIAVRKESVPLNRAYLLISLGIGFLCVFSAAFSSHPGAVLKKAGLTTLLIASGVFLLAVCRHLDPRSLRRHAWIFAALLILATAVAIFELSLNMPIYRIIHEANPTRRLNTSVMNRGAVNIVLCSFFALSCLWQWDGKKEWRIGLGIALFVTIALMLGLSQVQAAQLALGAGLVFYFLYPAGWKPGYAIFAVLLCALLLATPWMAHWLFTGFAADLQSVAWLKSGYAGARLEIWDFSSRYALQSPLTGHGMDGTRYVESFDHARLYHKEDSVLHPHNFAVQLWVDFGLIGAASGCALLVYILFQIRRCGPSLARASLTTFFLTLLVAALSYGMWQSHWIGVLIYLVAVQQFFSSFQPDSSEAHNIRQA